MQRCAWRPARRCDAAHPENGIALLERALEEPPGPDTLPDVLLELGLAEAAIFRIAPATAHLRGAISAHPDPAAYIRGARVLGSLLAAGADGAAAVALLQEALAVAADTDAAQAHAIEGQLLQVGLRDRAARPLVLGRLPALRARIDRDEPAGPAELSALATDLTMRAEPASSARWQSGAVSSPRGRRPAISPCRWRSAA